MVGRLKRISWVALCLALASCGGGDSQPGQNPFSSSDSDFFQDTQTQSSDQSTAGASQFYGYTTCLSQVTVLHSALSADPSQYEYKYACLNATGSSTLEVVRNLSAQATESLCPRSFTYTERASLGTALNIKLKAKTPTGPSSVFNSKKAYDDSLATTPCSGGKQSYSKKVGQGAHPLWMDIEIVP